MAPTPTGLGGKAPGRCPEAREVLSAGEVSWSFHRTCIRNGLDEGLDKFYGFYSGRGCSGCYAFTPHPEIAIAICIQRGDPAMRSYFLADLGSPVYLLHSQ